MVYVFGVNLPVMEIQLISLLALLIALGIIIWQMVELKKHVKVLEKTTFQIRNAEKNIVKRSKK